VFLNSCRFCYSRLEIARFPPTASFAPQSGTALAVVSALLVPNLAIAAYGTFLEPNQSITVASGLGFLPGGVAGLEIG